ncbi:MAG: hypothetical protein HOP15_11930 [Planctomycetes bacterium]|nr:hypothetical protein [Planctomycetota bacterium]
MGSIVSFSYLLTIDDPKRFEGRAVDAFLGLGGRTPSCTALPPWSASTSANGSLRLDNGSRVDRNQRRRSRPAKKTDTPP